MVDLRYEQSMRTTSFLFVLALCSSSFMSCGPSGPSGPAPCVPVWFASAINALPPIRAATLKT